MVVLSVGLNPPANSKELADKFGIELNEHGFGKTNPVNPMETTRPGIFISGAFQGPIDIPESVMTGSGACSQCGELLDYRRGSLSVDRVYPSEKDVSKEEPRVGVFVCHCGANIGRVVNVPSVKEYASKLPNVVHTAESLFICSTDSAKKISDAIIEHGLNRVLSPPVHREHMNRYSGTRFGKRGLINITTIWLILENIALGFTPNNRKKPLKRLKISSGWQ
jgi:heterodisulfide reductase subunit A